MLEGGIIAKLLEEKWKTFAQVSLPKQSFLKRGFYSSLAGHFLQADVCDAPPPSGHVCGNLFQALGKNVVECKYVSGLPLMTFS